MQRREPVTRDRVVQEALRLVAEEGIDALGVNRVARSLGLKPPSLYNHVAGNDDLRLAVTTAVWVRLAEALEAADAATPARAGAWLRFAARQPAWYSLLALTQPPDPDLVTARARCDAALRATMPADDPGAALALRAGLHGLALLVRDEGVDPEPGLRRLLAAPPEASRDRPRYLRDLASALADL